MKKPRVVVKSVTYKGCNSIKDIPHDGFERVFYKGNRVIIKHFDKKITYYLDQPFLTLTCGDAIGTYNINSDPYYIGEILMFNAGIIEG